jgi:hypothetical protein
MQGTRRPYSRTSWKVDSQKSKCRTVHRAPILQQIRPLLSLKAQNSNHYIWRTGIKMHSSAIATSRQEVDRGQG